MTIVRAKKLQKLSSEGRFLFGIKKEKRTSDQQTPGDQGRDQGSGVSAGPADAPAGGGPDGPDGRIQFRPGIRADRRRAYRFIGPVDFYSGPRATGAEIGIDEDSD